MSVEVRDNPERCRYEAFADGERAGYVDYRLHDDGRITLIHTEVDAAHEGAGVGSALARAALADARARSLRVVPMCPFIKSYIDRHPGEYDDLVEA